MKINKYLIREEECNKCLKEKGKMKQVRDWTKE